MTSFATRISAALAAAGIALTLSSCSTAAKEDRSAGESTTQSATAPAADHNAEDVMFAQMMIPHHQQAVELAALVPQRSTNPAVVQLAAGIADQQLPEISAMKAILVQWEVKPGDTAHAGGHGMPMAGMVDDATMARLEALKGAEFDTLWLQSMIAHHRGAIEMADVEIAGGSNVDMVSLARSIVSAQQREIDQMNQMLAAGGN